jgi:hypothetical protein
MQRDYWLHCDQRDQSRVAHTLSDIPKAWILAIASGYEDANNLDACLHPPNDKITPQPASQVFSPGI